MRHARHAPKSPSGAALVARLRTVDAVVLDTDGVITDSARAHAAAWKEAFDAALRDHPPEDPADRRPFDAEDDYRRYVDGKSRFDGAASFLASRGFRLSQGDPDDAPGTRSVWAVAARKEQLFSAFLREHAVAAWPGSVRLLRALHDAQLPRAAVSASRHARDLLAGAGVLELFQTVVDGNEATRLNLVESPTPRSSSKRPVGWTARRTPRPSSRMPSPEWRLAGPADSGWSSAWTGRPV